MIGGRAERAGLCYIVRMETHLIALACFVCAGVLCSQRVAAGPPGDMSAATIFTNGNIYTLDPGRPRAEAIVVDSTGSILIVGSEDEARLFAGDATRVVDLGGRTVLPGLIDAHGHIAGLGAFALGVLELSETRSSQDLVETVAKHAQGVGKGEWVLGGRWDHESWPSGELPTHEDLSRATPDNPVWLRRVDGHAGLANAEAMRRAGITRDTPSPVGGEILRDDDGNATGIFVDRAMDLITRAIDAENPSSEDLILAAQDELLRVGLTGAHDAGIGPEEAEAFKRLAAGGRLKIRVAAMLSAAHAPAYLPSHEPYISDRFVFRSVKYYMDGAMGSRGAWLLEAYEDRPTTADGQAYTGLALGDPRELESLSRLCLRHGWQMRTHAIGDRGNREVLDAYERALMSENRLGEDHRFAVEHAQMLHADDIPRFARLGVLASMQPRHQTTDMRWVAERIGEARATGTYAWASLLRSGARIPAGSDFPVEPANPFLGFYACVTRADDAGEPAGGWHPQEKMTREEALRAFTLDAAYAAFQENLCGSLEPGKSADFVVIDRDVMTCPERDILGTVVLRTVIRGETVYEAQ